MDAERLCRTTCLLHTQRGNLGTSWDRRVGGALRAIRRDDHVDLDALTCIPREDRGDRPFIVGVRPNCHERSSLSLNTRDRHKDKNQRRKNSAEDETHDLLSHNAADHSVSLVVIMWTEHGDPAETTLSRQDRFPMPTYSL